MVAELILWLKDGEVREVDFNSPLFATQALDLYLSENKEGVNYAAVWFQGKIVKEYTCSDFAEWLDRLSGGDWGEKITEADTNNKILIDKWLDWLGQFLKRQTNKEL